MNLGLQRPLRLITVTEWHLEQQEQNSQCPNRASANANTQFGHHQPINSFFLNHHHHRQCPPTTASSPPSPHHHCHIIVTITNSHLHPHPSPTTSTARLMWQCHITNRTSAGHIDNTNDKGKGCHVADCDVATT